MKYRKFIEENMRIDEPKQGKLVPFVFNTVQNKYYNELCRDYNIEKKGLSVPIREKILKARREGVRYCDKMLINPLPFCCRRYDPKKSY